MQEVYLCIQANVPVIVWGPPGVGKTARIEQFARATKRHLEVVIASTRDPTELSGLQVVANGDVKFVPAPWAKRLIASANDGIPGIFCADELSTAAPASQAACLRVINERWVGDVRLPSLISMVAIANPADQAANGYELTPPLANRLCHIVDHLTVNDWVDGMVSGFPDPDHLILPLNWETHIPYANALVASFIKAQPSLANDCPKDEAAAGGAWPSFRTWTMAARLIAACRSVGADHKTKINLVAGCVGEGPAISFLEWEQKADLPDPEIVLADPHKFDWPVKRGDKMYAILAAVAAAVIQNNTVDRWVKAWEVMGKAAELGGADVAAAASRALVGKNKPANAPMPRIASSLSRVIDGSGVTRTK